MLLGLSMVLTGCDGDSVTLTMYRGTVVCTKYTATAQYGVRGSVDCGAGSTATITVTLNRQNQMFIILSSRRTGSILYTSSGYVSLGTNWRTTSMNFSDPFEGDSGSMDFRSGNWHVTATYDGAQVTGKITGSSTTAGTWGNILWEQAYTFTATTEEYDNLPDADDDGGDDNDDGDDSGSIVGTWQAGDTKITFSSNGNYEMFIDNMTFDTGTYTASGGHLTMISSMGGTGSGDYDIASNKLTGLNDGYGNPATYTKIN